MAPEGAAAPTGEQLCGDLPLRKGYVAHELPVRDREQCLPLRVLVTGWSRAWKGAEQPLASFQRCAGVPSRGVGLSRGEGEGR